MTSSKIELTELLFAHARFSLSMAAHIRRTARSQLEDLDRWMPVFAGISGLIPRSLAAAEAELGEKSQEQLQVVEADMTKARPADRASDQTAFERALVEVQRVIDF
jgi:hypothetical protein